MSRQDFSGKIKDHAFARASGKCENKACGLPLQIGKYEFDHILPDALGGKPTLANCMVLCVACHGAKTAREDVPRIRKADRQRKAHIGAKTAPARKLEGKGFQKPAGQKRATKQIEKFSGLPRRSLFQ